MMDAATIAQHWGRILIIVVGIIVAVLWALVIRRGQSNGWAYIAGGWVTVVVIFFAVRYLPIEISAVNLNLISQGLYLTGMSALGGVALAQLQSPRRGAKRE